MAASKLILSHTRRHFTTTTTSHTSLSSLLLRHSSPNLQSSSPSNLPTFSFRSSFLGFHRFSSSSSSPTESENSNPINSPPPPQSPQPVSYAPKPVSYAPKPTDPSPSPSELSEKPNSPEFRRPRESSSSSPSPPPPPPSYEGVRGWTREDIRYVKDVQSVSISPVSYQVRVANLPEDRPSTAEEEEKGKEDEQLERERRRIETETRLRRAIRAEEESSLPFPSLIKVEKKKPKVVLDLQEAIREVKANAKHNFVETIEAHVGLGVDPKRGDQMVRGATTLPHGIGKVVRVAVFAEGEAAEEARAAGADIVGAEELIEEIRKGGGKINFDKCIATPIFMPRLGKIARILGPRGLMPNPKLGSVTSDVAGAVREAKRGRIDFKIDKTAIVHVGLGKVNFPDEALRENVGAFVNALLLAKPVGLKKTSKYAGYVKSFSLCSTMGPAFPISIQSLSMAADHYNKLQLK